MHEHVGNFSWATMEEMDAAKISMRVVQAAQIVESQELDEKIYRHLPQAKEYKVEDGTIWMGFHFETINSIGTALVPQEDKTIMAQQMNETQRLQALEAYNPAEHLIKIKGRDGVLKDYYPAAWRFYELNLRYPNANFSTDLIFFDLEKNFCVVKVRLYLGPDYETSDKKAESMKQGLFTALDKIETAAKARCLRDFGIGTEYALEFSDDDELGMSSGASAPQQPASERDGQLATIKEQVKTLGLAHNPQQWTTWKKSVLGQDVADGKLTPAQVAKLNGAMEQAKSTKAA